ncbi:MULTISPECIES: hypothetical protein [Micrococcaceae]|uniref:Uncharacterized protein n=1 Tax=Glutamicibacter soli TaxID=453836 RepID=A0A365YMI2_9MICC|nr:hypothetical protein [Glutamicibacter soli]RBM03759.1 hypothetical protein C1H84_00155 [Glutamicibacter soli]
MAAASVAYAATVYCSSVTKATAAEESARKQVEWAIDMAVSDSSAKRIVGLSFIDVLLGKHGAVLEELMYQVVLQGSGSVVDDEEAAGDNEREADDDYAI